MIMTSPNLLRRPGRRVIGKCVRILLFAVCLLTTLASLCTVTASNLHVANPPFKLDPLATPTPVYRNKRQNGSDSEATSTLPNSASTYEGNPPPTSSSSPHDPTLAIMPEFAFSMPAQIVVDGINLALTTVLTLQLIVTMRYHFPLSKKNYCLQSASTLMLLLSLSVHMHTVLNKLMVQSRGWPYMFSYIAVQIPPQDGSWNLAQEVFYLLMRAMSTLLIHVSS